MATESMYNRDLVADLFKLASIVIEEGNDDLKVRFLLRLNEDEIGGFCLKQSSENSSSHELNNQFKVKDDQIKQLEIEKRTLLQELINMRYQQGTRIPS